MVFKLAARHAGQSPKKRPTNALNAKASSTDSGAM
jgi:hypothetical protein